MTSILLARAWRTRQATPGAPTKTTPARQSGAAGTPRPGAQPSGRALQNPPGSWWTTIAPDHAPVGLRTDQPHSARMYDYYLGGKDNFPADREAAEAALGVLPYLRSIARQNRAFMTRTVRHLARSGIRQFLDVGTGIPTSPNLHEVVQEVTPQARVVYADNDPIVLTHARALLSSNPAGRTAYLDADVHDVERILDSAELRSTLDLSEPVALSMIALLHFIPDTEDPHGIVSRFLEALPAGSYLVLSHGTGDVNPESEKLTAFYRDRGIHLQTRDHAEFSRFFDGLELVEPGVQIVHRWRPDGPIPGDVTDAVVNNYGAVGRKP